MCERCTVEVARERYIVEDNRLASLRELGWTERTRRADAEVAALRQSRRRLIERCRPRSPAITADPFMIATDALARLTHVRNALERAGAAAPRSDDVRALDEAVKRLAWGPTENDSPHIRPTASAAFCIVAGQPVGPRGFEPRTCGLRVRSCLDR